MSSVRAIRQSGGFPGLTPNSRARIKEVDQVLSNVMKEVRVRRKSLEHVDIVQLPNVGLSACTGLQENSSFSTRRILLDERPRRSRTAAR